MIYLDSNVIIRFVEGDIAARLPVETRLRQAPKLCTSQLSRLECRCRPIRMDDHHVLRLHDTFFNAPEMTLLDITNSVIDKATELRATYRFKTPDALHLASAIVAGASAFITADIQLRQCRLVNVEIV